FGVKNMEAIRGKHILIVDDVTTTGATLRTAKATLLPYGPASVTCVALAH
ncbi:TPA: phosphoribosyltransferase, partial [Candidatus Woesearchaeota archaeon]|nr:phosphoribosyltransferase [Candidatus Woesearchaeota archaeon]